MTAASICYSMPGPSKLPAMLGVRITIWGCIIPYKPSDSLCYWPARPAGPARQPSQPAAPGQSCSRRAASRPAGQPACQPHRPPLPIYSKCLSAQPPTAHHLGNVPGNKFFAHQCNFFVPATILQSCIFFVPGPSMQFVCSRIFPQ